MELFNWAVLVGFLGALLTWVLLGRNAGGRDPEARQREDVFFRGRDVRGREIGLVTLMATLLISWIFAKSIQNAADLGQELGLPGGVAYAGYWLAFVVAGVLLYKLRKAGYRSIHHFLHSRFGLAAVWVFSLIILFRLWNELWSNTMVVAQFFGETGSPSFLLASWVTTLLVLAYSLVSGFRGSIVTDVLQMGLAAGMLLLILGLILPQESATEIVASGSWTLAGGLDLLLVAFIQVFSYPFHDPVMTDRGFLTRPRTMLRGFVGAGILGVVLITLFSFVGVFNHVQEIGGNSTLDTALALGLPALLVVNIIMLTSATSTLDSAYASTGKLAAVDLQAGPPADRIRTARVTMVVLAFLGGIMVHASPAILSATTVSGTMVLGLTPVALLGWWRRAGAASFHASVGVGLVMGLLLALGWIPYEIGDGLYGDLLFANVTGVLVCFAVFAAAAWMAPRTEPSPEPSPPLAEATR